MIFVDFLSGHYLWRSIMQNVIGIDISKRQLDGCALFDGKTRKKLKVLNKWISKRSETVN